MKTDLGRALEEVLTINGFDSKLYGNAHKELRVLDEFLFSLMNKEE